MVSANQRAPGDLERVRDLLNSWRIPNDVRRPVDRFDQLAAAWPARPPREGSRLRALRDDLRKIVEHTAPLDSLNPWLDRLAIRPRIAAGERRITLRDSGRRPGALAADYLAVVVTAIWDGSWPRLKACPDCRWVFFDHSRNATKRWCMMTARGPTGRACGTLDKVRRFRERQRAASRRAR